MLHQLLYIAYIVGDVGAGLGTQGVLYVASTSILTAQAYVPLSCGTNLHYRTQVLKPNADRGAQACITYIRITTNK